MVHWAKPNATERSEKYRGVAELRLLRSSDRNGGSGHSPAQLPPNEPTELVEEGEEEGVATGQTSWGGVGGGISLPPYGTDERTV